MENMLISGNTHPGKKRKGNQDAYISRQMWSADKALLTVIDGVGGYAGGEKAASIAKECIEQYMQTPRGDTLTMLREAVIFANNKIVDERKKDQRTSEMCCVLTAVVADASTQSVYYTHIGDTRLYCYRNGKLMKLTRDHSFVGIKEDAGEITEIEAMEHPHRNQILREVGSTFHRLDDEDFMDYGCESLLPGDLLLLCSDGLTDMLTSRLIIKTLSTQQPVQSKVNKLISLANEHGGNDNITVVLLQNPGVNITVPTNTSEILPVINSSQTLTTTPAHKSLQWGKSTLWIVLLFIVLLTGAGWYFVAPKKSIVHEAGIAGIFPNTENKLNDSNQVKISERVSHTAVPGPVTEAKTDTLFLRASQDFTFIRHFKDSSGNLLVLQPAKNTVNRFAAISIAEGIVKPGDTLLLNNIQFNNFETGIDIHVPVILKTGNLIFENTLHPFRYLLKPGEKRASILFINKEKQ